MEHGLDFYPSFHNYIMVFIDEYYPYTKLIIRKDSNIATKEHHFSVNNVRVTKFFVIVASVKNVG
jgi:hypothetical protein